MIQLIIVFIILFLVITYVAYRLWHEFQLLKNKDTSTKGCTNCPFAQGYGNSKKVCSNQKTSREYKKCMRCNEE